MCAVCGLPTNHASLVQALALVFTITFVATSLIGAWLFLLWLSIKRYWQERSGQAAAAPGTHLDT